MADQELVKPARVLDRYMPMILPVWSPRKNILTNAVSATELGNVVPAINYKSKIQERNEKSCFLFIKRHIDNLGSLTKLQSSDSGLRFAEDMGTSTIQQRNADNVT
ncbi:MAG: hypothetical protein HDS38_09670 [Bacteroides sp.]|nr:hypothetical protein [Bacteroides sp.]MBD5263705.1 hypothetical protein [Bacteroides sp.]